MSPTYRYCVCAAGDKPRLRNGETPCVIGRDVVVNTEALENYCFQLLSEREFELALLAGAIAFVDRSVRRLHSEGWARRLEISMPVQRPDEWNGSRPALQELLQFLTGDYWHFEFAEHRVLWGNTRQDVLPLGTGNFVVIPFSNGLDSFAQSQLLKLATDGLTPIRITAWNHGLAGGRDWSIDADGTKYWRVSIPIRISVTDHPEPSFRTRSFLFNVFAGIAAHLAQAESVIVPENGQGAIGPSIVPFGAESPQRGAHPYFTRKLGKFLGLVLGKPIIFQHPQLWRTKGEVLQLLKRENLLNGWMRTISCPRDRRDINLNKRVVHCGVCAGCLLRRTAVNASFLEESENTYLWCNLESTTLAGAIHSDSKRRTRTNDLDIANHGVLVMSELAKWADSSDEDPIILQTAFDIAGAESMTVTMANLKRLLRAHRDEWNQFRNHFSSKSWINSNFTFL